MLSDDGWDATSMWSEWNDIVSMLKDGIAAAIACKPEANNGPYCISTGFKRRIKKQYCVGGGTVLQGLKPGDYEREWDTADGIYVIDAFGPKCWIFDLDSQCQSKKDDDLHQKVPVPGSNNCLRILNPELNKKGNLTGMRVEMRDSKGGKCHRLVHQILQMNLWSWGYGLRHNKEYERFLRSRAPKRGATSAEDAFPYTGKDYNRYLRRLKAKGWTEVEFAKWCDVDHCVGRSEPWMHTTLFTRFCSHRWNTCMSIVRYKAGDWCFGLGAKAYRNGND